MISKILSAVLIVGLSLAAHARAAGYVKAQAHWADAKFYVADPSANSPSNPNFASIDFADGPGVGLSAGWVGGADDRHEIGLSFTHTRLDAAFEAPNRKDEYEITILPIIVNYRFTMRLKSAPFSLVAGPDLGFVKVDVASSELDQTSGVPTTSRFDTRIGSYKGFMYGGAVGARWHVAEDFYFELSYANLRSTTKADTRTFDRGDRKLVQEMLSLSLGGRF